MSRTTDVDTIMSQCYFTSTSYAPSATNVVVGIQVQATKPATTGTSASAAVTETTSSPTDTAKSGAGTVAVSVTAVIGIVFAALSTL